jgi:DNA-binding transcriptional LysR family regulator
VAFAVELRQLTYFVTVAETGGFGRAARKLSIVQAAVSQQIQRLERELGVRLFDRSHRQVRLTAAGERLLPSAYEALAAVERLRTVARATLRVGVGRAFDPRVRALLTDGVESVRLSRASRLAGVRDGTLDAAIVRGAVPDLAHRVLWTDPVLAAVPASFAGSLEELPLRMAAREKNPAFHDLVVRPSQRLGPELTTLLEALHDIGAGQQAWTAFYPIATPPEVPGVEYRPYQGLTVDAVLVTLSSEAERVARRIDELVVLGGRPDRAES